MRQLLLLLVVMCQYSTGFTPLGGIMMGTRCGDIDPAIVPYVMKKTGMTPDEMDTALNKKSGMLGISGISAMLVISKMLSMLVMNVLS